jgi:hypothetical protein
MWPLVPLGNTSYCVWGNRDNHEGAMVGWEEHAVYEQLLTPFPIKWAQIAWYRLSEAEYVEELVVDRIGDGDGVRELIPLYKRGLLTGISGEALDPGACPARADGTGTRFEIVNNDMSKTAVLTQYVSCQDSPYLIE